MKDKSFYHLQFNSIPYLKVLKYSLGIGFLFFAIIYPIFSEISFFKTIVDPLVKEETSFFDLNLKSNGIFKLKNRKGELNGSGIVVGLKEKRIDSMDLDIVGRVLNSVSSQLETSNHATEMATIIGGNGYNGRIGTGVAESVSFYPLSFNNLSAEERSLYVENNISVVNHSYGTQIEPYYGKEALSYDQSVIDNPTVLHVFSAGNQGESNNTPNLTGNFKNAKNVLVVGVHNSELERADFSSYGSPFGNFYKPDLLAYSAVGSSNGAALVSGAAVLLKELNQNLNEDVLEAHTIKSILITGAIPSNTANEIVSVQEGYGVLQADRSAQIIENNFFKQSKIDARSIYKQEIKIPVTKKNFRLSLVWSDLPSELQTAFDPLKFKNGGITNNLNLKLINKTDGEVFLPFGLKKASEFCAACTDIEKDQLDTYSNVEFIYLPEIKKGVYEIVVEAMDLSSSTSFGVSYFYEPFVKDGLNVSLQFPSDDFPVVPLENDNYEVNLIYHRDFTSSKNSITLSFEQDLSILWNKNDDITGLINQPIITSGNAKFRYLFQESTINTKDIGGLNVSFSNSNNLTLSQVIFEKPISPKIIINCTDSLVVEWPRIEANGRYIVYEWSNGVFSEFKTTTDRRIVFIKEKADGSDNGNYENIPSHIAIQFVYENEKKLEGYKDIKGYRSSVIQIREEAVVSFPDNPGGDGFGLPLPIKDMGLDNREAMATQLNVKCLDPKLFFEYNDNNEILLFTDLISEYGIKSVTYNLIDKNDLNKETLIGQLSSNVLDTLKYKPDIGGTYRLRASVELVNGRVLKTNSLMLNYVLGQEVLLFPNPLSKGEFLNIQTIFSSESKNLPYRIYTYSGNFVQDGLLKSELTKVPLVKYRSGQYIIQVDFPEGTKSSQFIIK